ncbi:MAG: D-mannonate epimerase [Verrucomicrobia bacterium]|nr:D-mannonate epimerase [Verrucomicrobiota bacterium]
MIYFESGSPGHDLTPADLKSGLFAALEKLGSRKNVIAVPPDFTRFHSRAGELTQYAYAYYGNALKDVLPALGTHTAMPEAQLATMFGDVPRDRFRVHDWRKGVATLGEIAAEEVHALSEGAVNYAWPAQLSTYITEGHHDLILSIGQVVPHEVIGMANYTKNLLIGTGGADGINKSHYMGAAYGMERIMGRARNPVRELVNRAASRYMADLPVLYVLTVVGLSANGQTPTRGLFIGDDDECFYRAADLALQVNVNLLDRPIQKAIVYLDPHEFKSTWLGNKSIYRTRLAIADGGELIILAPSLREFGEDPEIDRLIRKYGYMHTDDVKQAVLDNKELQQNLSAAAHLIHGTSDGRFSITYCPGQLSRTEIESVHYQYADLAGMTSRYNPKSLRDGYNIMPDGEEIFFVSKPSIGLWAERRKLA